jgi:hypothetical protein
MGAAGQIEAREEAIERFREEGRRVTIRRVIQSGSRLEPVTSYDDELIWTIVTDAQQRHIDGQKVKQGDKEFVFYDPREVTADFIIIDTDGLEYNLGKVEKIQPGTITLMYFAWGRVT